MQTNFQTDEKPITAKEGGSVILVAKGASMKNWRELPYGKSDEPLVRQMSYDQAQRIYNLFCERLSYTRTRSGPLRRKMPLAEKQRFMETTFKQLVREEDFGGAMFPEASPNDIDQFHAAKTWYESLREKVKTLDASFSAKGWKKEDILKIAHGCGAEISGFAKYYDPVYKKEMVSLVFGVGMLEVNKLKIPCPEAGALYLKKNIEIQNITGKITEKLLENGVYCNPVPCATYYHVDNLEFNQVRFCEAALPGCIGKNFVFLCKPFGPKFRMGQVILQAPLKMKFPYSKSIDFCKDCLVCVDACPSKALKMDDAILCSRYLRAHDHCSICMDVCPVGKN